MASMEWDGVSLDRLRVFVLVTDRGGFSAAARASGRSQSAVSHAVAELERALGVALFDRSGWRPAPTDAGRTLLAEARALLARADALKARARALAEGVEAELSAVVDVLLPQGPLTRAAVAFQAEFPHTPLRLHVEALRAVAARVLEGECSVGVMASYPRAVPQLERTMIGRVALGPVAAPSHPLASREGAIPTAVLAEHVQLVLTDRSEAAERDFGVLSARTWRLADLAAKRAFLLAGLGWGNMPLAMVADDLGRGELVRLAVEDALPQGGRLPLYAVRRTDRPPGPAGRWLADRLREEMAGD